MANNTIPLTRLPVWAAVPKQRAGRRFATAETAFTLGGLTTFYVAFALILFSPANPRDGMVEAVISLLIGCAAAGFFLVLKARASGAEPNGIEPVD